MIRVTTDFQNEDLKLKDEITLGKERTIISRVEMQIIKNKNEKLLEEI